MKSVALYVAVATLMSGALWTLKAQTPGQAIFEQKCAVCHSTGTDRVVGPPLAGVTSRRNRAWLKEFIMQPDRMLAAGDEIANALLQEYQVIMPNLAITEPEAEALIAYLDAPGAPAGPVIGRAAATTGRPDAFPEATEEQVLLGQGLFQGTTPFTNGGPTCNSCHEVTNDAVIGGGVLARELTTVFSRLGGPGVRAILGSPPFPVMQRAYRDMPLTEHEVAALVGFLQRADEEHALHQPRDYGPKLFTAGVGGAAFLLVLYSLAWRKRLRRSVNQAIYDRQIRSI